MIWILCFLISLLIFLLSAVWAAVRFRAGSDGFDSVNPLLGGVLLSGTVLFFPFYFSTYVFPDLAGLKSALLSLHHAVRIFVIDVEFSFIADHLSDIPDALSTAYFVYAALLYFVAPLLTVSVALSLLKNMKAYRRYLTGYFAPLYVFSEWNEKSASLGRDIKKHEKNALIVYADADEKKNSSDGIFFRSDILSLPLRLHGKKSKITLFAISENEDRNIRDALKLAEEYKNRPKTALYVFASGAESEILFSQTETDLLKIRRVNEFRSFVYNELANNGYDDLFLSAREENGIQKISAVIVGTDPIAWELTKTLPWFCQMDGYRVQIDVFAAEKNAWERLKGECPELTDPAHNGKFDDPGDAQYQITVHDETDFASSEFREAIAEISDATFVFVSLGDDADNIQMAMTLRRRFEQLRIHPVIRAVVTDPDKKRALRDAKNFSDQPYDIGFVGDTDSRYTAQTILNAELEQEALKRHMGWPGSDEASFWRFEYNYKSSLAAALHNRMKIRCGIPEITLPPQERSESCRWAIRKLEHRRWNAFIRSEGFVYSRSIEKSSRNNLAKMHNCLVPFDELPPSEQEKDDI